MVGVYEYLLSNSNTNYFEIHVLARKEVTIFRICYIGNKIWTWEDTNCDKVSAW
jgi:hypothetical protein